MNRLASAALASAFLAATGGIAVAANAPGTAPATPANTRSGTSGMATPVASGDRMTHALNLLEAKGYGDFREFKPEGKNFSATVTRAGKQMSLMVNPDNNQVTVQG